MQINQGGKIKQKEESLKKQLEVQKYNHAKLHEEVENMQRDLDEVI